MINFFTENINERWLRRTVENTLTHLGIKPALFLKDWRINIYDLKYTDVAFYRHIRTTSGQHFNPEMPSGVTGKFVIDLYLHDSDNEFKQLENADRIQHEICHAALYGTPHFVKGVHDNNDKGKRFKINYWYFKKYFWKKTQLSIIDIREFLKIAIYQGPTFLGIKWPKSDQKK